jgi:poly-beta-1,6-N-acetyl-D-glucosamine synthase
LLHDLSRQEYKNFEIIVVNDDSEDETLWMVSTFEIKNLQVIHNKGKGKKAAITSGIKLARGTIIVTTDADCSVPPQWLKEVRAGFRNPKIMMTFGAVRMEGTGSFFDDLQSMEFASLIGSGASAAALGFPIFCNGANLAFRKKAFLDVKGYEGNLFVPSGDDEFLMQKMQTLYPGSIRFLHHEQTVVTTHTQPDPDALLNQRVRWASKWRYNSSMLAQALAVVIVLLQVTFIINWCFIFSGAILYALFLIVVKLILEAAFLLQVCRFIRTRWNWLAFFSLQVLYPLYVVTIAVTSFFVPFQWKNRIFKPH